MKNRRCLIFFLLVFSIQFAYAENLFVTPSGAGSSDGSDWNNAFAGFGDVSWGSGSGQLGAGDTLWIAGGNYTTQLEIKGSGNSTALINLKRVLATDSEANSSSGWSNSFDSQVIINATDGIMISSGLANGPGRYILLDGRVNDGIRVNFLDVSGGRGLLIEGYGSFNSTFTHIGLYGPSRNLSGLTPFVNDVRSLVIRNYDSDPSSTFVSDLIFDNDTFSGASAMAYLIYTSNITIQNSDIHTIETINSDIHANLIFVMRSFNNTIRYNNFHDNAGAVGIFFTDFGSNGVQSSNFWIYGNIFRDDNGTSERFIDVRDSANGTGPLYIYNNVFVNGYGGIAINAALNSSAESYIKNNLFVNVSAYQVALPGGEDYVTVSDNLVANYSVFVNEGSTGVLASPYDWQFVRDLHLVAGSSPIDAGVNLGSPFNIDADGNTRGADGSWDVGAYEYVRPTVYYVSTTGSNSSNGSAAFPWKNIQYALNTVTDGDTIYVENGTYSENLTVSTNNLVLSSTSSVKPIINGSISISANNFSISKFEITGWNIAVKGISMDGSGSGYSGLNITNCSIHSVPLSAGTSANQCVYIRNLSAVRIEGNEIYNCTTGITINSARSLSNNYSTGVIVRNNSIYDNAADGMDIHGTYITVENNQIYDNMDYNWSSTHPDGIQGIGSTVDGLSSVNHVIIRNNLIRHHTQNIFLSGVVGGETSDCNDTSIYNNVLYNTPNTVVGGVNISSLTIKNIGVYGCKNLYIYGNTIGYSTNNGILIQNSSNYSTYIKNNIIMNNSLGITVEDPADLASGGLDYNLYYGNNNALKLNTSVYNLRANITNETSYESHGSDSNPNISDFPTPTLQENSPAINIGLDLGSTFSLDFLNIVRPQGFAWDLGAYEYVFSSPIVSLISPTTNSNYTTSLINFNCSVSSGNNLSNITLYGNWSGGWHANETKNLSGLSNSSSFSKTIPDGIYSWNCLVYDNSSLSDLANTNYSFSIDSSVPIISIVSPENNSVITSSSNLTVIYNVSDLNSIDNCSFFVNNISYINDTSITKNINQTFSYELTNGAYNFSINCYDSFGNIGTSAVYWISISFNDTSAPSFTFNSPQNNSVLNTAYSFVNITTNDSSNHSSFVDWNYSLKLWLPFDVRNSSGHPTDLSTYSINGTKVGNAIFNSSGIRGGAFTFNTSGDVIKLTPTNQNLNITNASISFWSFLNNLRDYNAIFDHSDGNYVVFRSTGQMQVYWVNGTGTAKNSLLSVGASTGVWQFFVITYNVTGNNVSINVYRNGQNVASANATDGFKSFPITTIGNFNSPGANFFNGSLDEFMVFNRTLSSQEILALYESRSNALYNNFTNLQEGIYYYKASSIDSNGNYNVSDLRALTINYSADVVSPLISIVSPTNTTYNSTGINFNISANENLSACVFSFDSFTNNFSMTLNSSLTGANYTNSSVADGSYTAKFACNDTSNNWNSTQNISFSVDATAPNVTINSPTNSTYTSNGTIAVNISLSERGYCEYTLNSGTTNITLTNNSGTTFTGTTSSLSNAAYTLKAYCNDSLGNKNYTATVNFTVSVSSSSSSSSSSGGGAPNTDFWLVNYPTLSEDQLKQGYTKEFTNRSRIGFNLSNETHHLGVIDFNSSLKKATVNVSSDPQIKTLSVGEEWKVDVNVDGTYDLIVKLNNVTSVKANLTLLKVSEVYQIQTSDNQTLQNNSSTSANSFQKSQIKNIFWIIFLLIVILGIAAALIISVLKYRERKTNRSVRYYDKK